MRPQPLLHSRCLTRTCGPVSIDAQMIAIAFFCVAAHHTFIREHVQTRADTHIYTWVSTHSCTHTLVHPFAYAHLHTRSRTRTHSYNRTHKENKEPAPHTEPQTEWVTFAGTCQGKFGWTVGSQQYYHAQNKPPPRFCGACATQRNNKRKLTWNMDM